MLVRSNCLANALMDLFPTNRQLIASRDVNRWTGVIVMFFLSCLDSHTDGIHSLQRIHCRANDVMLKSDMMKKQTHLYLGLRVSK